jgi:hypothetical protein
MYMIVLEMHGTCGIAGTIGAHQLKLDENNDKSREDALNKGVRQAFQQLVDATHDQRDFQVEKDAIPRTFKLNEDKTYDLLQTRLLSNPAITFRN